MKTLIIADNLVNDFCGIHSNFTRKNMHIGIPEVERMFGTESNWGKGPLPTFLINQIQSDECDVILFRNTFSEEDLDQSDYLEVFGEHCVEGTQGHEFLDFILPNIDKVKVFNCDGLSFPLLEFKEYLISKYGIDIFSAQDDLRILIIGFHTEKRILSAAQLFKNYLGINRVAIFSHFVSSSNRESHFSALRNGFANGMIEVIHRVDELANFLDTDLSYLKKFNVQSVEIKPKKIVKELNELQLKILESICMHWTEANLKPLSGGFSGSALFIAQGKQGTSNTEPMVVKIDSHDPIRAEVKGYNLVKDLLGKHVPTFTLPISKGKYSGVGMELASMDGAPSTLQDRFEKISDDYSLDAFLKVFDLKLSLLSKRLYKNTQRLRMVSPFRHFMLHISKQEDYLKRNLDNIKNHDSGEISIMDMAILGMFNVVRKNSDAVNSEVCISHGDLNFANIIVDNKENLWTIDWTHSDYHPLEIDFAKMENDIKFVMSKDFKTDDLIKLKIVEDHLVEELIPVGLNDLPVHLDFILWDLRFKKLYLAVKKVREYYKQLKSNDEWVVYKIALLRYATHTLSFDKSIGRGECSGNQLWHALVSVETLLFQIMADDYHLKIRGEKPENYPNRQRIQIDLANWKVDCPDYNPPYFVDSDVLSLEKTVSKNEIADSESNWSFDGFIDWGRKFDLSEDGKPLNPAGRTGIEGRGSLPIWGSNPTIFLIPIRYDESEKNLEILLSTNDDNYDLINVQMRRNESLNSAKNRIKEIVNWDLSEIKLPEVQEGYLYDPRQTDNAWVESKSFLYYSKEMNTPKVDEGLLWKSLDHNLINSLYSSHGYILRDCVSYIYKNYLKEEFVQNIIEKTG